MKKKHLMTTVALMLLTAALTYCITLFTAESVYNAKLANLSEKEAQYERIAEVLSYIEKYYVNEYDENQLTDGALYGIVSMLGDRWSRYLTPDQFSSVMNSINSKVVGIGVNTTYDSDDQSIIILDVFEDSPAEYAKLQPFDRIISVDGKKVSDIGYDAAVKSVSGAVNTPVSLVIERDGVDSLINMSITRREIDVPNIKSKILDENIGYVKIVGFDTNADRDAAKAIDSLKKANVTGLIFDVRNNPGGLMSVLVNILDPLLPEGVIIREEDKNGKVTFYNSDKNELDLPMVVLTNEYSVSAAEFFAEALREAGKASIVGEPTTGKGMAQSNIPLKDGAGLVLSVSKYFTGRGNNLDASGGIKPDYLVELTEEEYKNFYLLSDKQDRQLQEAIRVINEKRSAG